MKYYLSILIVLLASSLMANPEYYPMTSIVEGFSSNWCVNCPDSYAGMNILDATAHNGELLYMRYYTTSGDLSSPVIEQRFEHYQVFGVPAVIFNGKIRIEGGGEDVVNGSTYHNAYSLFRHASSPLKMSMNSWNASTGAASVNIEMVSPTLQLSDEKVYFLLIENNVAEEATRVVRDIAYGAFDLSGAGTSVTKQHTFTINPSWNQANLWVVAFVQQENNVVLQSTSSLSLPAYNFRVAMDWNQFNLVTTPNNPYTGPAMWFYNLGLSDDYQMQIVVDSAPDDWYFNYCDEEGLCLPGSVPMPLSLAAGTNKGYHLNILVGSSGTAHFRFRISSPNLGTYDVPFRLRTNDVAADDPIQTPLAPVLGSAYPNPFTAQTTIEIQNTKKSEDMWIDFYNLRGQRVDSIFYRNNNQELSSISWTPKPELSRGIYYYRLRNSEQKPKRLIYIP